MGVASASGRHPEGRRHVIVIRNSPDWAASATLWRREKRLDPSLFLPDPLPPGFPTDTMELIELWNRLFAVDFFSIRQAIRDLAVKNFKTMSADHLITQEMFESAPDEWIRNSLLFFTDDDDFACPDLFDRIAPRMTHGIRCVRWSSISIGRTLENRRVERRFPRLRPWLQFQAELRPRRLGFIAPLIASRATLPGVRNQLAIGPLHTNNYLIDLSCVATGEAIKFVDHLSASAHLWKSGLRVESLEWEWLSFTNKHPASISAFSNMVKGADSEITIRNRMAEYIRAYSAIEFPVQLAWVRPRHQAIAAIYKSISEPS